MKPETLKQANAYKDRIKLISSISDDVMGCENIKIKMKGNINNQTTISGTDLVDVKRAFLRGLSSLEKDYITLLNEL